MILIQTLTEHLLCAKDWINYLTYLMSDPFIIPAGVGVIIPILQIRRRTLTVTACWRSYSWTWTQPCLVAKPLPLPGFPLAALLLQSELPVQLSNLRPRSEFLEERSLLLKWHHMAVGAETPGRPWFLSQGHQLPALWLWASYLASLCFMVFHHQNVDHCSGLVGLN